MTIATGEEIAGFEAPVHRSLTEPILLAGAPRAVAIINGTVSAALGLGLRLWITGLASSWSLSLARERGQMPLRRLRKSLQPVRHLPALPWRGSTSGASSRATQKRRCRMTRLTQPQRGCREPWGLA
jgi:type IV secretory pathway TrbD component